MLLACSLCSSAVLGQAIIEAKLGRSMLLMVPTSRTALFICAARLALCARSIDKSVGRSKRVIISKIGGSQVTLRAMYQFSKYTSWTIKLYIIAHDSNYY